MENKKLLELLVRSLVDAWMTEGVGYGLHSEEEAELDKELIRLIDTDSINDKTKDILKEYYNK